MIHAVYSIILVVSVIILIIIFRSKRSREVWYKIIAKTETHNFVLEGYEDNVRCFLFKIRNDGKDWALLRDFSDKENAQEYLDGCLGDRLSTLSEQEMTGNVPPPRILDI